MYQAYFGLREKPFALTPNTEFLVQLAPYQACLNLLRVAMTSFASAFLWALALSMVGKFMMATPLLADHHELLTKCLLVTSFALFVIAVAAAEVGVGLALVLLIYRNRQSIDIDDVDMLKG